MKWDRLLYCEDKFKRPLSIRALPLDTPIGILMTTVGWTETCLKDCRFDSSRNKIAKSINTIYNITFGSSKGRQSRILASTAPVQFAAVSWNISRNTSRSQGTTLIGRLQRWWQGLMQYMAQSIKRFLVRSPLCIVQELDSWHWHGSLSA